jgi:hypothetical protein
MVGCAGTHNPYGDEYDEPVVPGKTRLFNLTGSPTTEGSAEVYFAASSRVEMLVTFRDRLLAVQVDGKALPGTNKGGQLSYPTGYQAIALTPGIHSISYCHVTRSGLATGVKLCNFSIKDYNFEPNARYMVGEELSARHGRIGNTTTETVSVGTNITRLR